MGTATGTTEAIQQELDERVSKLEAFRAAQECERQASAAYEAAIPGSKKQLAAARAIFRAACAMTRVRLREYARALAIEPESVQECAYCRGAGCGQCQYSGIA